MPNYLLPFQFSRTKIKLFCDQFVDRGDPAAVDLATANFTADGLWHDLDLSAIVPYGSSAVFLRIIYQDELIGSSINFKRAGNANDINSSVLPILVADLMHTAEPIVHCDSNSMIQYNVGSVVWSAIYLSIRGWWI